MCVVAEIFGGRTRRDNTVRSTALTGPQSHSWDRSQITARRDTHSSAQGKSPSSLIHSMQICRVTELLHLRAWPVTSMVCSGPGQHVRCGSVVGCIWHSPYTLIIESDVPAGLFGSHVTALTMLFLCRSLTPLSVPVSGYSIPVSQSVSYLSQYFWTSLSPVFMVSCRIPSVLWTIIV